ncbi:hypothetical protein NW759_002354 [Fusarium solani]|nr:hypothetical protein NW759_002354 [Fusarium solani]
MAPAPAPSADGQPTWEFEDWFDGEYLDQLLSDYLQPEGQELVEEVARQVKQLSLASNLSQEVTELGEQPALAHDPTVSGRDGEPSSERQGDDHQLRRYLYSVFEHEREPTR